MPSINMIAPRRAEAQRLEHGIRRLIAVILVEFVAVLAITGLFYAKVTTTRSRIADLDVELTKLQPIVRKIEFYDRGTASIQPKVQLLNDAKSHTMRWYRMMQTLSVTIPEDTWLTRIAVNQSDKDSKNIVVNLSGVAADQNLIGDAMLALNSYPGFESVDLHYTQKAQIGTREVIEFEVGAGLKMDGQRGVAEANGKNSNS